MKSNPTQAAPRSKRLCRNVSKYTGKSKSRVVGERVEGGQIQKGISVQTTTRPPLQRAGGSSWFDVISQGAYGHERTVCASGEDRSGSFVCESALQ